MKHLSQECFCFKLLKTSTFPFLVERAKQMLRQLVLIYTDLRNDSVMITFEHCSTSVNRNTFCIFSSRCPQTSDLLIRFCDY